MLNYLDVSCATLFCCISTSNTDELSFHADTRKNGSISSQAGETHKNLKLKVEFVEF